MIFTLTGQKKLWLFTIYRVNLQSGPALAQAEKAQMTQGQKQPGQKPQLHRKRKNSRRENGNSR